MDLPVGGRLRAGERRSTTTWHNLEASVRTTDEPWELPEPLASAEGPLVYLSLGSLGSADVGLMKTLIATLADSPFRVIVSKGPQHAELDLADNMTGAEFLPQASILPQVDLVITHGGNNTVTESLYYGKPMVLLPLFWDQYDNAQRIDETGYRPAALHLRARAGRAPPSGRRPPRRRRPREPARRGLETASGRAGAPSAPPT